MSRGGAAIQNICDCLVRYASASRRDMNKLLSTLAILSPKFDDKLKHIGHAILIYKDPSSLRRSSWRPRARRDFTVPTLMSRATAISS